MAERPHIVDFGLLEPLSIRDRLRGERMCAAAGKPLPKLKQTAQSRPWRRRPEKQSEGPCREVQPTFHALETNRKATARADEYSLTEQSVR
jgi:hypothetical protein